MGRRVPAPPAPDDFWSRLRGVALTVRLGAWLGVTMLVAFLTGLVSHWAQDPSPWLPFPTAPSWGYRLTQGLHVAAGTAAVPLLLVKLWSVYPRLFAEVRERRRSLAEIGVDRVVALLLVSSALFMLVSGLLNAAQWYPWAFTFRRTHFAVAWILAGAVLLHLALKAGEVAWARRHGLDDDPEPVADDAPAPPLSRRTLLRATGAASVVAVVVSAASTVPGLRRVAVLGVRTGEGPQGLPVNKSAVAAKVVGPATDPDWRLEVVAGGTTRAFSLEELESLPQHTASLPIACVEGWSASGEWTGVRVRDLLAVVSGEDDVAGDVRIESLQPSGAFRTTLLPRHFARHEDTLLALRLHGEPLVLDHGFPCRLIAPNRPGVLQTKWLARLEVQA